MRQAQAIHAWRPWEKSTGPRTPEGKAIVTTNVGKRLEDAQQAALAARHEQRDGPRDEPGGGL